MKEDWAAGDRAAVYDEQHAPNFDPAVVTPVVDALAELAVDGKALELAVGTGRIALPLAERGIRVFGIDSSEAMVERLRAKPGGEEIEVTIGDFATAKVDGPFALVYLVYDGIFELATQEEQVACFQNVAAHLDAGGLFVVEALVPRFEKFPDGETVKVDHDPHTFSLNVHDAAEQRMSVRQVVTKDGKVSSYRAELRYTWPSELDLMARLAGLTLHERWGEWNREPFTGRSSFHVSLYRKP